jgi:tetratricopeptide (TPR) repeat protein
VIDAELPSSPNIPVRHLAFFRAASTEREGSNEYRTLLAGLLVLRLLDKRRVQSSDWQSVRNAVEAIDDGPIRRILRDLVDAIQALADGRADTRMAKLIAYAQLLESDTRWDPAADAYLTATELASPDRELLPFCYQRASICSRKLGFLDRAADLLRKGQEVAAQSNDHFWLLRLRTSVAKLQWHRGDLPEAERLVEAVIAEAQASGFVSVVAEASHDRGLIAYDRGHDGLAVEYYYTALKAYTDARPKLRAMHDLALALSDMGHLYYSRTVLSAVRNSPHVDGEMRDLATLNLMRVAVLAGEELKFDQLRRELIGRRLEGRHQAHYHMFVGQGYLKFGQVAKARQEFADAVVVAQTQRLNKIVIEAEELLNATPEERAPTWKDEPARPSLAAIFEEIRNRRGEFAEATE